MLKWRPMPLLRYTYKQPNDWTCGPAVARIILHLFGMRRDFPEIIKELGTTRQGTANRDLARLFKRYGLSFTQKNNASLSEIKKRLKSNWIVTAYWIPFHQEAHYSIITKVNAKRVFFHDPWFGSSHSYSREHFLKNWWDGEGTRWFMAVPKSQDPIQLRRSLLAPPRRRAA